MAAKVLSSDYIVFFITFLRKKVWGLILWCLCFKVGFCRKFNFPFIYPYNLRKMVYKMEMKSIYNLVWRISRAEIVRICNRSVITIYRTRFRTSYSTPKPPKKWYTSALVIIIKKKLQCIKSNCQLKSRLKTSYLTNMIISESSGGYKRYSIPWTLAVLLVGKYERILQRTGHL